MFRTEKPALLAALQTIRHASKGKATVPILSNALFERHEDRLMVTGSNLDTEISATFAAEIDASFEPFTCHAETLAEIVRNAPDGFNINVGKVVTAGGFESVQIAVGKAKVKLPTLPATDFPSMKPDPLAHQFTLDAATLAKAISTVSYATETNEQRYAQCGVLFDREGEDLNIVASDGNRFARRTIRAIAFDDALPPFPAVIVHNDVVSVVIKILEKHDGDVTVEISDVKIRFVAGSTILTAKLVDGTFLAYRRFTTSAQPVVARISAKALTDAVARVMTVSGDAKDGVAFTFEPGRVSLLARDINIGEAEDEIAIECEGEVRTGFNGRFLRDALAHLEKDEVEMVVSTDRMPSLLRCPGDENTVMMIGALRMKWAGLE